MTPNEQGGRSDPVIVKCSECNGLGCSRCDYVGEWAFSPSASTPNEGLAP